jgi:hypothetical protein
VIPDVPDRKPSQDGLNSLGIGLGKGWKSPYCHGDNSARYGIARGVLDTAAVEITSIMKRNSCGEPLDSLGRLGRRQGRRGHTYADDRQALASDDIRLRALIASVNETVLLLDAGVSQARQRHLRGAAPTTPSLRGVSAARWAYWQRTPKLRVDGAHRSASQCANHEHAN